MKTWLKVLIIIAVISIIAAIFGVWYANKPNKDIEKAKAEYTLNVNELYKQYTADTANANSLYNGKVIEVSGNISKIETPTDTLIVAVFTQKQDTTQTVGNELSAIFDEEVGIRCTMLQKYNEETKKITPNTTIKIKGLCKGMDRKDLIFEKCSIVK